MTNFLVDSPPTEVKINGQSYPVNWDFRSCLRIILAFEDEGLAKKEKAMILLRLLYPEIPEDIRAALDQGIEFLNGGLETQDSKPYRVFSFSKDANLIVAGFRQTYHMDLQKEEDLHWWSFLTLFLDLGPDTTFSGLVNLRGRVKSGKATKQEREMAQELGETYEVPEINDLTIEEMERERTFFEALEKGKDDGKES